MHYIRTTILAATLAAGACLGAIPHAAAAGFDCALARSPIERAICTDPVLNEQDEQLNARWREVISLTQYPDALKSDQIAWLGKRNHCSTDIACLRRNYAARLAELAPDALSGAFDWAGAWVRIDGPAESGMLLLQQEGPDRYRVTLSATSGGHLGELDGFARLNEDTLLLLPQDDDDCRIVFRQAHRQLEIEQQNGQCGAGMGVTYSGRYLPVPTAAGDTLDRTDANQAGPPWDLLNLGIVEHPDTDAELRRLLEPADYQALVANAQFDDAVPAQEAFEHKTTSFRVHGQDPRAVLMQSKDGRLWVALLEDEQVRYYSNAPDWIDRLPTTVRSWIISRHVPVTQIKLMSARGKVLPFP